MVVFCVHKLLIEVTSITHRIMSTDDIQKTRTALDSLDQKLLELLSERRKLSLVVASTKSQENLPLRDLHREETLLIDRIKKAKGYGLDSHFVTKVFHEIVDDSIRLQQGYFQKLANSENTQQQVSRVAFHGIEGSYSYLAAQKHFARNEGAVAFVGCSTFSEVIHAVENGVADYGILPLENAASGGVTEIYNLLRQSSISLVGEEKAQVAYCLVGSPGAELSQIKRIYCHAQAVNECRNFLSSLQGVRIELFTDSATSVRKLKEEDDPTQAAIASEEAAQIFSRAVLKRDIANQRENFTRYVIAARAPRRVDLRITAKTSIVMATSHEPGSLVQALTVFRDQSINLTKLESRAVPENLGEELFYVDFEGNIEDPAIQSALQNLARCSRFVKVLGCYPSFDLPPHVVSPQALAQGHPEVKTPRIEVKEPSPKSSPSNAKKGYTLASREFKPQDTIIEVKGIKIGGPEFVVMAGPCSVESYDQILSCAREAKEHGAVILRGGCFKPRTSPYSFQGLGFEGLDMMAEAGKMYGLPIITEVMAEEDLDRVAEKADIIQLGARNMQNYALLKAVGKTSRPVMLKRSLSAPIEELLQAVEYILAGGNQQVMLCERGIRTFETATRYTLDLSAVPVLRKRTHLPIIVDPSHAAGERDLVPPLALAAKAVGAQGIIVEFHPEPEKALSDGPQALRYPQFEQMMRDLFAIEGRRA
jgi:chorismate mutase/prephenate dehydratase